MKQLFLYLCAFSISAYAGTSHWTHTTEADFKNGKFENVVATNLGDLKLSRAVKTLLEQDPRVSAVYALAEAPDGTIYAGTGPQGIVLQAKGEKVTTLATLEDENVYSLIVEPDGKLLVGTGGEKGRILRIDPNQPANKAEVFSADGVQYVWKVVRTRDGSIYAGTGPNGQLFEIKADGASSVLLDTDENNILSLIGDGNEFLYAGTDPNGLVYRVNRRTRDMFVMYDAAETEVTALAIDAKGNLFAATGQAAEGEEMGMPLESGPALQRGGRPEGGETVVPLPSPTPTDPRPVPVPDPSPHEPDPIPKKKPNLMVIDPAVERALKQQEDPEEPVPSPPQPGPGPTPGPVPNPRQQQRPAMPMRGIPQRGMPAMPGMSQGNAIYRIDRDGFVTEVFRQSGMVLSMIERDGTLLVGTGSEGLVYQVNPAAEETLVLAKVEPKQITGLLARNDGSVVLGMSNVGSLATMSSGFASNGTFTSAVLDAGQISRFGKIHIRGSLPAGTALSVATRSGNLQEAGDATWSKWSQEAPAAEFLQVQSQAARFFQYRLTLSAAEGNASPVVDEIDVAHQVPNLAPQVKSIRIVAVPDQENARPIPNPMMNIAMAQQGQMEGKEPVAGRTRTIAWDVADPNNDALEYSLHFRSGSRGPWILLAEKVKEPMHNWDTRGVADGRYQVRVTASDVKSNPLGEGREGARVSDPIVVDNTAPVIGDVKATREGKAVKIEAKAVDRASTVAGVEYSVNSKDDWQAVRASDSIFDSPEEGVSFSLAGLSPGTHQVVLRASDDHGNQSYETILVTVEAEK